MENLTNDLPNLALLVLSPTRLLFNFLNTRLSVQIGPWSWWMLAVNIAFLLLLSSRFRTANFWCGPVFLIWLVPYSRVFEIGYAFYNDSIDHLKRKNIQSGLRRHERLKLLGRSYIEVAICFASLYVAIPWNIFNRPQITPFEALYFSWITITTTGFGDILPVSTAARCLCIAEIGLGIMLLVLAVGTYLSYEE